MTEDAIDLSNLLSPVVSLDTNVIRATRENSPPFQLLVQLAKAKSVRVIIPEIVIEERRTQWREKYSKNLNEAAKALAALTSEKIIGDEISDNFDAAVTALGHLDIEALSKVRYKKFLDDNGFESKPLTMSDVKIAWDGYFSGKPPFKEVKNRADIPDGHILASVQSISKSASESYFVAGDRAMFDAAGKLEGINAFENIDDLISSPRFIELRNELEVHQRWKKLKSLVTDLAIQQHVADFVYKNGDEFLDWRDICDDGIPEDSQTATIHSNDCPTAVSVGTVEDWGGGYLRCPVTFNLEANLRFMVFRGEAFDVPEWVSVSYGDFENDHYFDAEGIRELTVKADVSVKIDLNSLSTPNQDNVFDIQFEESSLEISLSEDQ